jgi:hypothetical protein
LWQVAAFLLEASARDALGEREAAGRALERGLDLAEPAGLLLPFLLYPVPELLDATRGSVTCDRCGPAVRALYRVHKDGELYLCGHCANRLGPALSARGWMIRLIGEDALTCLSMEQG